MFTKKEFSTVSDFLHSVGLDQDISTSRQEYDSGYLYTLRTRNKETYSKIEFLSGTDKCLPSEYLVSYGDEISPYNLTSFCLEARFPSKNFDINAITNKEILHMVRKDGDSDVVVLLPNDYKTFLELYNTEHIVDGMKILFQQKRIPKYEKDGTVYDFNLLTGTVKDENELLAFTRPIKVIGLKFDKECKIIIPNHCPMDNIYQNLKNGDKVGYLVGAYRDRVFSRENKKIYLSVNLYECVLKEGDFLSSPTHELSFNKSGKMYLIKKARSETLAQHFSINQGVKSYMFSRTHFEVDPESTSTIVEFYDKNDVAWFIKLLGIGHFNTQFYSIKDGTTFSIELTNYSELDSFMFKITNYVSFLRRFKRIVVAGKYSVDKVSK